MLSSQVPWRDFATHSVGYKASGSWPPRCKTQQTRGTRARKPIDVCSNGTLEIVMIESSGLRNGQRRVLSFNF